MGTVEKIVEDYPSRTQLEERVMEALEHTKREKIENITSITFNNKTIPLKTDKLKAAFKAVFTADQQIEDALEKKETRETLVKQYSELLDVTEHCTQVIRKEKSEETKKSEASG